ncbi:MAG TPA: DUF2177 family protein [Gammaproteobacteria bacterium]|jgi:uncharacterized membrane protein|nr:DUF2177 family protein [Gammaproteobacteria bacterium]
MPLLINFVLSLFFSLVLDMLWIGLIAKNIYTENIGHLLRKSGDALAPDWQAALIVYLAIITGIIVFALPKAKNHYHHALFWGGLFGAIIYGVYDFTNYSILANWPLKITLIDFVWGIFLCGTTTAFALFIQRWFIK